MNTLILIFYKIAAFFTRVTSKSKHIHDDLRAEKIALIASTNQNSGLSVKNDHLYINQQADLSHIPYGKTDMSFGGCGPIALYNALLSLNDAKKLNDILNYLEKNGVAFGAKLGTSPYTLKKYLENNGISTAVCRSKNKIKLNDFAKEHNTFITLIFNDAKSISKGLHFICTVKNDDGTYTTHNPLRTADTFYDALSQCSSFKIKNLYTLGMNK